MDRHGLATLFSTRCIWSANGRAPITRSCARRSFDAEIIFIALVICCVDLTARMRRRRSSSDGIGYAAFLAENCCPKSLSAALICPFSASSICFFSASV